MLNHLNGRADRAARAYSVRKFDSVVYIGDGLWDLAACTRLGVQFIGIGESTDMLVAHGARDVSPDYSNRSSFLAPG
jgi:phosphoglycolate phosphatase-like HAD superfamily hydrolase